jgi:hypothetical protein
MTVEPSLRVKLRVVSSPLWESVSDIFFTIPRESSLAFFEISPAMLANTLLTLLP